MVLDLAERPAPTRATDREGLLMVLAVMIALAVMLGAMAQRVSGMGFALVVAPVLVLLIGPFEGVLLVNLCGAVSASIVISRVWRHIDWRQFAMLGVPAVIAIVPGAFLSVLIGGPVLQIIVGAIVVAALSTSLLMKYFDRRVAQVPAALISGTASGFMSATAGVGGPGMSVYAILTNWEQRSFAATIQPFFVVVGVTSFVTKVTLNDTGLPDYEWWLWVLIIACTLVGLTLGEIVSRWVSVRVARIMVIIISFAGGIIAIIDGATALLV